MVYLLTSPSSILMKILGFQIQEDLKWDANTKFLIKKATKKLWILRRMINIGVDEKTVLQFYLSEVRVHLEYGCPVCTGGLTVLQPRDIIERVQRIALCIIMSRDPGCLTVKPAL